MPTSYGSFAAESASRPTTAALPDAIRRLDRALAAPVRAIVVAYRWLISPLLGANCRFEPSCSRYAETALARRGLVRGSRLVLGRVLRCHPWNPGGYDPVPEEKGPREVCRHG